MMQSRVYLQRSFHKSEAHHCFSRLVQQAERATQRLLTKRFAKQWGNPGIVSSVDIKRMSFTLSRTNAKHSQIKITSLGTRTRMNRRYKR